MRYRESLLALTTAALLAACGGQMHAAKPARQAVTASSDASAPEPVPGAPTSTTTSSMAPPPATDRIEFRFDPAADGCVPQPDPAVVRNWQVAAPRTPQDGSQDVAIGLRSKMAGPNGMESAAGVQDDPRYRLPAPAVSLWARVIDPDRVAHDSRMVSLLPDPPDSWISLSFASDFPDAPPLAHGTYTILWTTSAGPLACDGFTIS